MNMAGAGVIAWWSKPGKCKDLSLILVPHATPALAPWVNLANHQNQVWWCTA